MLILSKYERKVYTMDCNHKLHVNKRIVKIGGPYSQVSIVTCN